MDAEIRAMLNTAPEKFIAMAMRGMAVIEVPRETVPSRSAPTSPFPPRPVEALDVPLPAATPQPPPLPPSLPPPPLSTPPLEASPSVQPTELPPEMVAQLQEAVGLHEAADQTRAMAPGSPLIGVTDDAWREFVKRLERESPMFNSSRHVGQYRQRRERLDELGLEPEVLLGSAQAQRAALDADLVDAHQHAVDGGLLIEHVGRQVAIPGHDAAEAITLSGLLGVIQCAGLDGAVGWLERPGDRKRYPHTTLAFLRTNGVF